MLNELSILTPLSYLVVAVNGVIIMPLSAILSMRPVEQVPFTLGKQCLDGCTQTQLISWEVYILLICKTD